MRPSPTPKPTQASGKDFKGLKEQAEHQQMRSRLLRMILQNEEKRKSHNPPSAQPSDP